MTDLYFKDNLNLFYDYADVLAGTRERIGAVYDYDPRARRKQLLSLVYFGFHDIMELTLEEAQAQPELWDTLKLRNIVKGSICFDGFPTEKGETRKVITIKNNNAILEVAYHTEWDYRELERHYPAILDIMERHGSGKTIKLIREQREIYEKLKEKRAFELIQSR